MMYKDKLLSVGITANLRGFTFLNEALMMWDPLEKTMDLYTRIAKKYKVTPANVERTIRHAIEKTDKPKPNGAWIGQMKAIWDNDSIKAPIGWQCPCCGIVHSPMTNSCWCQNKWSSGVNQMIEAVR